MRIILEGHHLTFKTALSSHWSNDHDVVCISGDWNTRYGCPLWGYPTRPRRRLVWQACDTILQLMELYPEQTFILDRFHLSQQYYDKVFGTHYYRKDIEKRLAKMNAIIVYLHNHFDGNYEEALDSRRNLAHAQTVEYPATLEEYLEQECIFRSILQRSALPYVEFDVTGKSHETIADELETIIKHYLAYGRFV